MIKSKKSCFFCGKEIKEIDYKDTALFSQFISERGKILSRSKTGTCAKHQRRLARAVKYARNLALLPFAARLR